MANEIKRLSSFLGEYFDLLLAVAGGVLVAILGLTGQIAGVHLEAATLAILAALSAGLVRERWKRDRLGDAVRDVLNLTTATAPWEALEADYSWEILDDKGVKADASYRKLLRFLQTETLTIYEFSGAAGSVSAHHCEGRSPKSRHWKNLPVMRRDFPGRQGRTYAIISLEGTMDRGQTLEVHSKRELTNTFRNDHEYVKVAVEVPTGEMKLSLIWPSARAPKNVQVERGAEQASEIPSSEIRRMRDGRIKCTHVVSRPALGETITLSWNW